MHHLFETCTCRILNDENNDVWRLHCIHKLAQEALNSDILSDAPSYKNKVRAFYYAWNPNDCSRNIYVKSNGFTLHRNPVAQSTDGARGKLGFRNGRHCWEVCCSCNDFNVSLFQNTVGTLRFGGKVHWELWLLLA